jgi:outer membrane protein OmpA-like peptidoglycan-associated protein
MNTDRIDRGGRRWFLAIAFLAAATVQPAFGQTSGIITADHLIERLANHAAGLDLNIQFGVNNASVTPRAKDQMRELGQALASKELAAAAFEIIGHTDASGGAKANKALSERRAEAVRQYLIRNFGVAPGRLQATGRGEERLRDLRRPTHAINRRMEIRRLGANPSPSSP